ncbi:MAG: spore germination protein [Firmicutes bacterium]|nr:spore germination protein [Bacillota bacterium]
MEKQLTKSLDENLRILKEILDPNEAVLFRPFCNRKDPRRRFCLIYIDGMANSRIAAENVLAPLMEKDLPRSGNLAQLLKDSFIETSETKITEDLDSLLIELFTGNGILLVDGDSQGLAVGIRNWTLRSISEPEGEKVLQGPREGFTEGLVLNLAMLRRRIWNPDLKFRFMKIGKQTNCRVCMVYLEGIANPDIIAKMERKLKEIDIDAVLDTNYIAELIRGNPLSPFKTTGATERPDVAAAKILEGRIVLMVDGSPVALTAPFLFLEYFQTNDDYYSWFYFGSIGRILRILGFLITTCLPAFYLSLVTFHQELLPTRFLLNLSSARSGLPFPTLFEMILLILAFELIREGGSRIPSGFGQTLSIVGGLVLGQASVEAQLVSIPVVIIIAFTGITGLIVPALKGPVIFIRIIWLLLSAVFGIFGCFIGIITLLIHLSSLDSFGIPYTAVLAKTMKQKSQDTLIRSPWNRMIFRPEKIAPKNRRRQRRP